MQPVQLMVADEFKAFGDALGGLIADIKAGKTVVQDLTDAISALIPAVSGLKDVVADSKKVDNQVYLAYAIAKALEG